MKTSDTAAVVLLAAVLGFATPSSGQGPFESSAAPAPRSKIDELVFARLKRMDIRPASLSSDGVFVRRAFLDVIGTLPTADEARAFIDDQRPDKRAVLIDQLLERPEYADYWAMKWGDVLRVKSEFPINLWPNAVQAYHHWIRAAVRENMPYDRFARELLTQSGSNFRVPAVNFYRAVQSKEPAALASIVALTFMGSRTEGWPKERLADMSVFFSQVGYKATREWKEEVVFFDQSKAAALPDRAAPRALVFPDGTPARILPGQDPREVFAGWLLAPANPWFARAAVNRLWFWLLGRGIVHEPDDMRPDNPPANPELLAYLERELVASRYDMKHVCRLILNSTTYQLSSIPQTESPDGEASFAFAILRPLEAEVLIDAINQVTGMSEQYQSAIPEPFTFVPPEERSIALGDGSITSAFLEAFGKSPRDSGLASERSGRPTSAQRLLMLNGGEIQRKILQGPKLLALLQGGGDGRQVVTRLYLALLSRFPTDEELKVVAGYGQPSGGNRRQAGLDLAWALVNSAEFRFRH
jgi:hypothetical protein